MKKIIFIAMLVLMVVYYFYPTKKFKNQVITKIEVYKHKRKMIVYAGEKALNEYTISLGFQPNGKKKAEGDGKTPEGNYRIDGKKCL